MDEGTIAKWHKKEGDFVEEGDLLMEVATDKATVEYNALDPGFLRKILIKEGQEASVNQPIAIFTEKKDESIEGYIPEGKNPSPKENEPQETSGDTETAKEKESKRQEVSFNQPRFEPVPPLEKLSQAEVRREGRIKASPLAKKVAEEKNLDLASIKGSGPGGRIVQKDLNLASKKSEFSLEPKELPDIAPGSYEELPLTPMRKTIGRRLQEAKTFIPHFYVQQEVVSDRLVDFRDQLREIDMIVSLNDCVVKAVALALKKHPDVNTGFNNVTNSIIQYKTIDISVAVSTPGGLITPIIRFADHKNLRQISAEIHDLAKRARAQKLDENEYKGGSFTVSNLGMYGVSEFQAIINPPQSAILAVGGILERPIVKKGVIQPGKIMRISLSADHRVVDGVLGAEFVNSVKFYLENPVCLLMS